MSSPFGAGSGGERFPPMPSGEWSQQALYAGQSYSDNGYGGHAPGGGTAAGAGGGAAGGGVAGGPGLYPGYGMGRQGSFGSDLNTFVQGGGGAPRGPLERGGSFGSELTYAQVGGGGNGSGTQGPQGSRPLERGGSFGSDLTQFLGQGLQGGGGAGRGLQRGGSFGSELTAFVEQHGGEVWGTGFGVQAQSPHHHGSGRMQQQVHQHQHQQQFMDTSGELFSPEMALGDSGMGGMGGMGMSGPYGVEGQEGGNRRSMEYPVPPLSPQQQQQQQDVSPSRHRRVSPRRISPRMEHSQFNAYSPAGQAQSPFHTSPRSPQSAEHSLTPDQLARYEQAVGLVDQLSQLGYDQQSDIEKIRLVQRQLIASPTNEAYEMVFQQHVQLKERVDAELRALDELLMSLVVPPSCIPRIHSLQEQITSQQVQLEIFHSELLQLKSDGGVQCAAALVIEHQPFPMVVSKAKRMEDEVVVKVMTGAAVAIQSLPDMVASVVWDSHQTKGVQQSNLPDQKMACDSYTQSAKWNLKFGNGTRKQPVTIRFSIKAEMQLHATNGTSTHTLPLQSQLSRPFIVITNECQWEEGEGTLLRRACFGNNPEQVPWAIFANLLQEHVIRGTRQDAHRPTRCLTLSEFAYMRTKFFNNADTITPNMFDAYWNWFGKTFQKLRYQRHVLPLWIDGFIHGFLSRSAVNELLCNEEPGTFLVRFSEHNPGLFALGYRCDDEPQTPVRHYLIRPNDTNGAKRTLPDFLGEHLTLTKVLQVVQDRGGPGGMNMLSRVRYCRLPKNDAFERYYSKKDDLQHIHGYDDDIRPAHGRSLGQPSSPFADYMNAE